MSFLWVLLGPLRKLPLDIGEKLIFVDIMMNDQTNTGAIAQVLDKAEGYYRRARHHVILGLDGVLSRAWCLYEIVVRKQARRQSQVLYLRCRAADFATKQIETNQIDVGATLSLLMSSSVIPFSLWIYDAVFNAFSMNSKHFSMYENFEIYSSVGVFSDLLKHDFYQDMKAFKESDKEGIRQKISNVYGGSNTFNSAVDSATVHCGTSRHMFSLLVWVESILFIWSVPCRMLSTIISFIVVVSLWMIIAVLYFWYLLYEQVFSLNVGNGFIRRYQEFLIETQKKSISITQCFYLS